jgi:hypothetical protein
MSAHSKRENRKAKRELVRRLCTEADIRVSSIVRSCINAHLYIVARISTNVIHMRRVDNHWIKSIGTPRINDPNPILRIDLVYNPPDGWIYQWIVQPRARCGRGSEFTNACKELRGYVDKHLPADARCDSEYGELWRASDVEPLITEFEKEYEQREQSWNRLSIG